MCHTKKNVEKSCRRTVKSFISKPVNNILRPMFRKSYERVNNDIN